MKKIISYALITVILIAGLFVLTACGNKTEDGAEKPSKEVENIYANAETCELNDKWNGLNVKFAYPKDKEFELKYTTKKATYQGVTLTSKKNLNAEIEVKFDGVTANAIEKRKENYAEDTEKYTGIEDIEVAGYKGYTVSITDYSGTEKYVFLMLEKDESAEENSAHEWYSLGISIQKYSSYSEPEFDAVEYYNSEDFQNLLKSIIFTKTEPYSVDGVLGQNRDLAVKNLVAPNENYRVSQYPDTNGVMSAYILQDGKYNGSGAYFRVYSMEGIDAEKFGTLDKVLEYYQGSSFNYTYTDGKAGNLDVKIEHRPNQTSTSEKYSVWDAGYFEKDGKPYAFLYYRYEDVPEEIGTQLIDDVLDGMFLVTEE